MSVLGLALALDALLGAQRPPVFQSEIGLVVLQATVQDEHGDLVTGLDRSAFTVYENGKPQAITVFRRDDVPVSLGIALDNSGSMRRKREKVEKAALALVRASNPRDEVFLLNFADKASIDVPFTADIGVLESGIARLDSIGGTALRDAIASGEAYMDRSASRERKVLLVVSDGNDNASGATRESIRRLAERSGIVVYAIGLADEENGTGALAELDAIAAATGGHAYHAYRLEEVGAIALDVARRIRSQYVIGYSPRNQANDGSYRRLRVSARGAGRLRVHTRAGYRAASTNGMN